MTTQTHPRFQSVMERTFGANPPHFEPPESFSFGISEKLSQKKHEDHLNWVARLIWLATHDEISPCMLAQVVSYLCPESNDTFTTAQISAARAIAETHTCQFEFKTSTLSLLILDFKSLDLILQLSFIEPGIRSLLVNGNVDKDNLAMTVSHLKRILETLESL